MVKLLKYFQLVLWATGVFVMIVGGVGGSDDLILIMGILVGLLGLVVAWLGGEKFVVPRGLVLFGVIVVMGLVSLLWSENATNTLSFSLLILGFMSWWWWMYTASKKYVKYLPVILIGLGSVFGLIVIYNMLFVEPYPVQPDSLTGYASLYFNHIHIGDLWALALVVLLYARWPKKKYVRWVLMIIGLMMMAVSRSRSALAALLLGVFVLPPGKALSPRIKRAVIIMSVGLFLLLGSEKSILQSRPYLVQGVVGILYYPFGVGLGNFAIVSYDERTHLGMFSGYSNQAHSIVMEYMSGLGVLGLLFVFWLLRELINNKPVRTSRRWLAYVLFVVLTVNFLVDTTYMVPTMMWMWGGLLGLSQGRDAKLVKK